MLIFFAIDANRAVRRAESKTNLTYTKPSYLPPGFELSYKTGAKENEINYVYSYLPEKTRELIINIKNYNGSETEIYEQIIKPKGGLYQEEKLAQTTIWIVRKNNVVFYRDGNIYDIKDLKATGPEELIKIAESILNFN